MTPLALLLVAAFALPGITSPDSESSVTCMVIDSATGAAVVDVKVCCSGNRDGCDTCDRGGRCIVKVASAQECSLTVSARGYDTVIFTIPAADHRTGLLTVRLHPSDTIATLQKMTVRRERTAAHQGFATTSLTSFDRSALLSMPGSGNDVSRFLSLHPSAISMGTYDDNGIHVRGGGMSENGYVIDGIVFDNINHYTAVNDPSGSFGFMDMDLVNRLDFYTGGIPASLPSRSSAIVDIALRSGSFDSSAYRAKVSVFGAGVSIEGPVVTSNASYLFGIRFADMQFLNNFIDESVHPRHGDGVLKLDIDLLDHGTLSLCTIGSFDRFSVNREPYAIIYGLDTYFKAGNDALAIGLTWDATIGRCAHTLRVSAKQTEVQQFREYLGPEDALLLDRDVDTMAFFNRTEVLTTVHEEILYGKRIYTDGVLNQSAQLTDHLSFPLGEHLLFSTGVSGEYQRMRIYAQWGLGDNYYQVRIKTGNSIIGSEPRFDTLNFSSRGTYDEENVVVDYQPGGYCQMAATIGPFSLIPGVRVDWHSLLGKGGVSPRLGCTYANDILGNLSASFGMVRQLPADFAWLVRYLVVKNDFEGDAILRELELQRCFQANVGWRRTFGVRLSAGVEGYFKWYDREYPYESPYYRRIMMHSGERDAWSVHPADGLKKVYGGEVYAKGSLSDRIHYSGALTVLHSRNRYTNGKWYNDEYGLCRKGSFMAGCRLYKTHTVAVGLLALTGKYYSAPVSETTSYDQDGTSSTGYFTEQLDPIYSLSLKYGCTRRFRRLTIGADIDLINVLNQKIVIDKETDDLGSPERRLDGILPVAAFWVNF